jgi:hypothetical protein
VYDAEGVLIDGRNRKQACHRAGVQPTRTTLPRGSRPGGVHPLGQHPAAAHEQGSAGARHRSRL